MKKLLTSVLTLALILCCFTFVGCSNKTKTVVETVKEVMIVEQRNLDKVYDGKPVEEPIIYSVSGEVNFEKSVEWYCGDTKLSQAPINAGDYKVIITIKYGENDVQIIENEFTIEKYKVEMPVFRSGLVYNGLNQNLYEYYNTKLITQSGYSKRIYSTPGFSEEYTVFSLKDKTNYVWENGSSEDVKQDVLIAKKKLDAAIEVNKEYDGTDKAYIKLTSEHGLVGADLEKNLYLVVTFNSADIGATVNTRASTVMVKEGDQYKHINTTGSKYLQYYYGYNFAFDISGTIS